MRSSRKSSWRCDFVGDIRLLLLRHRFRSDTSSSVKIHSTSGRIFYEPDDADDFDDDDLDIRPLNVTRLLKPYSVIEELSTIAFLNE